MREATHRARLHGSPTTCWRKGFGPGFNGPLELVTTLHAPGDLAAFDDVVKAAAHATRRRLRHATTGEP